jgi:riboflavin synthase
MFTGLIESVGRIAAVKARGDARGFIIDASFAPPELHAGDSIAVDGVCLTVVEVLEGGFAVDAIEATIGRTTAGEWSAGRAVNLERALRAGQPLGGHLVQGHVDATGIVARVARGGDQVLIDVELPEIVAEVTVLHGSITIDGISLTVSELPSPDSVRVAIIPFTWTHTNLSRLQRGDRVNLEGDLIGRHVVEHLKRSSWTAKAGGL